MSELLGCPFCGGDCDPKGWMDRHGTTGPECEECGATAPNLEAWNRRAQPAPGAEALLVALKDIAEWTERWTTPGHPVATIARKAIATHQTTGEAE